MRFVSAVGDAGDEVAHHPRVRLGEGYVELTLLSRDANYRDDEGTEHVVDGVTQKDVDLARRITEIAAELSVAADPSALTTIELALDTPRAGSRPGLGSAAHRDHRAQGRGTVGDDVVTPPVAPILWFQDTDEHATPVSASISTSGSRQRWPISGSRLPSRPAG